MLTTLGDIPLCQSRRLPPNPSFVPLQTPLPRKLMLHHRPRIPVLLRNLSRLAALVIWIMHCMSVSSTPSTLSSKYVNIPAAPLTSANCGTHFLIKSPSASNFSLCSHGLNTRKYGCGSTPVDEEKPHPPLLDAKSPSMRCVMKYCSPRRQSRRRCFARKEAVIMRRRLCM